MSASWRAVVWAEGLIVVGLVLLGIAVASTARWCTIELGCDGKSSSDGGIGLVLVVPALLALAAGPVMAARVSGWPRAGRRGALAVVGLALGLVVAALAFAVLVDDVLPALVVALGVAGLIAVRPPSRGAVPIRLAVLAVLVVAAGLVGSDAAILALALLTLPAIALADSLSR